MKSKAQASTEFLLVMAMSMLVLAIVFVLSNDQGAAINAKKSELQAASAASDLANAARQVYAQGKGARKTVSINLPPSYNQSASRVAPNAIVVSAGGTDYVESTSFFLSGTLPSASGVSELLVENAGTSVNIGSPMASLNESAVAGIVASGMNYSRELVISSLANAPSTVSISTTWVNGSARLAYNRTGFALGPYGREPLKLVFYTYLPAQGTYSGMLNISAAGPSSSQSILIPLYLETVLDPPSNLFAVPTVWKDSIRRGNSKSRDIFICSRPDKAYASVVRTTSPGAPGSWVSGPSGFALAADDCTRRTYKVTVPGGAVRQVYLGNITFTGDGADSDYVVLNITVT